MNIPTISSRFFTHISVVLIAAVFLASCSATSADEDKKVRLQKLKDQQTAITKEIQKLEAEIASQNPDSTSTAVRAKDVAVSELKLQRFDHYVQTQGHIESENNVVVSAESMGVIEQVFVTEGQRVSKGQTLAQIDNSIIARNIESMEAQLELATSVYERQKNLWDQKIGTEVQFLQAKTNMESLEKQIASLREQNEKTRIKSPLTGTVDAVVIRVGESISPGMPAVRVVNNNDLEIQAQVSEAYVTKIKTGNKALVNVSGLGKELEAKVTFVGRTIDRLSRTFPVEVQLPSHPDLRPNMTATVRIVFNSEPSAIAIPVNLIQEINDEKVVYIAEERGNHFVATRKVVTVEGVYGNLARVNGLNAGDKIVTVGYQGLNDGDYIKI